MARKQFLTPPAVPEDEQCRGLVIPASQEWLAVYSKALLETTYAHNYEQIDITDLTPDAAAAEAYTRYVAWLGAECGGECSFTIADETSRIYRISPTTKHYEYLEGDEWVEDTEVPGTPPRTEPDEGDRLCAAASNAVEVLRLTWVEGKSQFDDSIVAQDAMVDMAASLSAIIGGTFYPPLLALSAMLEVGWTVVYTAYAALTAVSWDAGFTNLMTCIFLEHASDDGDVVTFDLGAILQDLWTAGFTGAAYLTMVAQMQWILGTIGPDAVNMAGSLDLVEANCDTCGVWCRVWNLTNMNGSEWEAFEGDYIASGALAVHTYGTAFDGALKRAGLRINALDTTDCIITSLQLLPFKASGSTNAFVYLQATPSTGVNNYPYANAPFYTGASYVTTGLEATDGTTSNTTFLEARLTTNATVTCEIRGIKVTGTGSNPFASGSVC